MSLSSTTLFHFTKSYEIVLKILENGLWPRFCVERDWGDKDLAIPMVCTCDIPLSEISFHQKKYGKYGIGLKKSWAKKNGFTPVLYLSDKSDLYKRLCDYSTNNLLQPLIMPISLLNEEYLLYYAKRSVGTDADRERMGLSKKPKFINEREWRYVPLDKAGIHMWFTDKGKGSNLDLDKLSVLTQNCMLKLYPADIQYIFLSKEDERNALIKDLESIFPKEKVGMEKLQNLQSRIITEEQISNDF